MRMSAVAAIGLVSALALPASAAVDRPAPFAGQVAQGETDSFVHGSPVKSDCIQIAVQYSVSLRYAPTSDLLTLCAGGATVTGADGAAPASSPSASRRVIRRPMTRVTFGGC